MKASSLVALLSAFVLLTACATTHPGKMALVEKGVSLDLKLSAEVQSAFSDKHYTFVTVTVENTSNDMIRIKSSDLDFVPFDQDKANILVGDDLIAWAQANDESMKKAEHNRQMAQLGMVLGGTMLEVAGAATHNDGLAAVGALSAVGGAGWMGASAVQRSIVNAHNPRRVPDDHIYAPFSVPAGKFQRRWLVIQKHPNAELKKVYLNLIFEDGSETTYALPLD